MKECETQLAAEQARVSALECKLALCLSQCKHETVVGAPEEDEDLTQPIHSANENQTLMDSTLHIPSSPLLRPEDQMKHSLMNSRNFSSSKRAVDEVIIPDSPLLEHSKIFLQCSSDGEPVGNGF
jgi:hypothetical protein